MHGEYGQAPPGATRLILGHESLGEVVEAPRDSGLTVGQHVAGIVRRPDPVPCISCAHGEWDMCVNGQYTEHGIKGLHGFGADYFRVAAGFAVPVDASLGLAGVLMEPTSVVAKAWDHIDHIASRSRVAAEDGARHRCGADRAARAHCSRCSAATRCTCSTA